MELKCFGFKVILNSFFCCIGKITKEISLPEATVQNAMHHINTISDSIVFETVSSTATNLCLNTINKFSIYFLKNYTPI